MIEAAARERGMPVGPFTFVDEIGLETALRVGASLFRAFPGRVRPSGLLVALVKSGHLDRRSGAGFFLWPDGMTAHAVNPAVDRLIAGRRPAPLPREAVGDRLFRPLTEEAGFALRDGTASGPPAVAAALRHGIGFRGSLPVPAGAEAVAA